MKLTTIKLIGFGLMLMFGVNSCQSFNCGCPMAEVKERGSEGEMLRIGESERGRLGEGVIGRGDERVTGRLGEGERGEFEVAD